MKTIIFFEKPGCIGNQAQKKLLRERGFTLDVKDLLSHPWQKEELKQFFNNKPVPEWFNSSAPDIKSAEIDTHSLSENEALTMMLANPILIQRPLLCYEQFKQSGFISGEVFQALGLIVDNAAKLQDCPMQDSDSICESGV